MIDGSMMNDDDDEHWRVGCRATVQRRFCDRSNERNVNLLAVVLGERFLIVPGATARVVFAFVGNEYDDGSDLTIRCCHHYRY
jgi:hypothetical protein